MQAKTLGGAFYFVTLIDDHSRKVWATALKTKDLVLDVFKDFHAKIEKCKSVYTLCSKKCVKEPLSFLSLLLLLFWLYIY